MMREVFSTRLSRTLFIRSRAILLAILFAAIGAQGAAAKSRDAAVEQALDKASENIMVLRALLRKMPKGGDLHNHLAGSPYAEEYIDWAGERGFCIDTKIDAITPPPCTAPNLVPARGLADRDVPLYTRLVNSLSMRGHPKAQSVISGHNQFFSTFGKFASIAGLEPGKSLASVRRAAARDNVSYLELGYDPPVFDQIPPDAALNPEDFAGALDRFAPQLPSLVAKAMEQTKKAKADVETILGCADKEPVGACAVDYRLSCYGLRVMPQAAVFRQIALCFALAQSDPTYVGMSLVAPEDDPVSLANYTLHMRMVAFMKSRYPAVTVSLHAGELTIGLVDTQALKSNIADAINIAGSRRIGHGVGIAFETNYKATLAQMVREGIAVEINLSSNDAILGLRGKEHPINLYRAAGVPIVLSTDDQGVLRSDMTEQYVRAVWEHGLKYKDLKAAARNSLHYAFIPGDSIWLKGAVGTLIPACRDLAAPACAQLIAASPKAKLQARMERDFVTFEQEVTQ